jgi:hypothetical protein
VHKLGCDQPKTTKELLDITIQYPSGEEAIGVIFILGDGKTILDAGRGGGGHHPKPPAKAPKAVLRFGTMGTRLHELREEDRGAYHESAHSA